MSMGLFAFADYAQATNGELEINNEVISSSGKEEQLGGAHSNVDPELFLETYTKSEELHHQKNEKVLSDTFNTVFTKKDASTFVNTRSYLEMVFASSTRDYQQRATRQDVLPKFEMPAFIIYLFIAVLGVVMVLLGLFLGEKYAHLLRRKERQHG